jgi:hypothetical protein
MFSSKDVFVQDQVDADSARVVQILQNTAVGLILAVNSSEASKRGILGLLNALGSLNRSSLSLEQLTSTGFPAVQQIEYGESRNATATLESICHTKPDFVCFEGNSWRNLGNCRPLTQLASESVLIGDLGDKSLSDVICNISEQLRGNRHTAFLNKLSKVLVCFSANLICPSCKVGDGFDQTGKIALSRGAGCPNCLYFGVKGFKHYFEIHDFPRNTLIHLLKEASSHRREFYFLEKKLVLLTESIKKKVLKDVLNGFLSRDAIVDLSGLEY